MSVLPAFRAARDTFSQHTGDKSQDKDAGPQNLSGCHGCPKNRRTSAAVSYSLNFQRLFFNCPLAVYWGGANSDF
jgi:hypothetical protein